MVGHWQTLLAAASADPEQRIANLPLLTEAEQREILVEWNDTERNYPSACVHELIQDQVLRTPDAVAVVFGDDQLTYRQLNSRANQLAHHLRRLGVGPEVLVGICMERSMQMIVALLGVMKAGGAYVPLDPSYPAERLAFMVQDSGLQFMLTSASAADSLSELNGALVYLDRDWPQIARESSEDLNVDVRPENLVYVIYTSGSTGKPKGAMNTHRGLCNRLLWMQDTYSLCESDRVLQKTPFSFDVSVWEFFWPLLAGARLVFAKPGGHQDPAYLAELINSEQITTSHFVPSMLREFLNEPRAASCMALRRVICSGEALPIDLQQRFLDILPAELHNLYGPTEASIDVTSWACERDTDLSFVPIGRPIANTQIYILDSHLNPVPTGIPGELHIGGVGLARGYWRRPELTAEKFIRNPFSSTPGSCLYKTGDLARFHSDGTIEYLGRIDHQVKLRGFRIELGEIESVLRSYPGVADACVVVREDHPGDARLVGYYVPEHEQWDRINDVRKFLKRRLPAYMVPALVEIHNLPLSPNGKLDRRALPRPEMLEPAPEGGIEDVHDPTERLLQDIWSEVLRTKHVNTYDNFFDLGGHSLLAIQVVARVEKELGLRIKAKELAFQTLGQLAASCKERLQCNETA